MKKFLAILIALAMVMSLSVAALASGEASGEGGGVAPVSNFSTDLLAATASISVVGDEVTVQDDVEAGEITSSSISGTYIAQDEIGDWDGSTVFGNSGIVLAGASADSFKIGGEEDVYEVDGEMYNTVVIMGAEDKDEENALGGSTTRDDADASEGVEGAGIVIDVPSFEMDNVYIFTEGYGRSALHLKSDVEQSVIKNSTIVAIGSDGAGSSAPGFICMYASSRPVLIESSGDTYFYNDDLISSDWGVYSLDGCYGAHVYIVGCYSVNTVGGYSMYSLGFAEGQENYTYFYGSYAASAQYGTIVCAAGRTYTGALSDATDDALAQLGDDEIGETVLDDGWSYIGGLTNAVTMQADMSGAEIVGILDCTHTVLDTANVVDRDGNAVADTMELNDYLDDMSVGASYFFLTNLHGATIGIRSENVDISLDDCILTSSKGVAVQTVIGYDTNANNIMVADGTEYHGVTLDIKNMDVDGDILHEDYQRKMVLSLENATLEGAVVSYTHAAWQQLMADEIDELWTDECDELGLDVDSIMNALVPNDSYETIWGVRMSIDADSTWTVPGDSSLYSLDVEDGAVIQAADGQSIEINVDCDMNGEDLFYDYTTGTQVDSLDAGSYSGVVILVND